MPIPLSAIIPSSPSLPNVSIYVARSELPERSAGDEKPTFKLMGLNLLVFWPGQDDPFSVTLPPADMAAVVEGKAIWEEVDEQGHIRYSLAIAMA